MSRDRSESARPTPRGARGFIRTTLALTVVAGALGGGMWLARSNPADVTPASSADLAQAEVRSFEVVSIAGGDLKAANRIELRSEVERETAITWIAEEGTRVKAGDLLVQLSSEEIEKEIVEAELAVGEAQLELEEAQTAAEIQISDNTSELRKAELALKLAELTLQQWQDGDDTKQRQENALAIEKAQRDLARLEEQFMRSEELYAQNFISKNDRDLDEIAFIEAKAAFEQAVLTDRIYRDFQYPKDKAQHLSDVEEARAELERVVKANEVNLRDKMGRVENRKLRLRQRTERLAGLRAQLDQCTVRAPSSGLVIYGSTVNRDDWRVRQNGPIAVGRRVSHNELLLALPDTAEMQAIVNVPEALAGRVEAGQRAEITIDAIDATVTGRVLSVGVLARDGGWRDPNRRDYEVTINVLPSEVSAQLKPSMRCDARIILDEVGEALAVPVQAVFNDGPVRYVYTPVGGRFAKTPIRVERVSDTYAEVTGGLEPGDVVLVREPTAREVMKDEWDSARLVALGYSPDGEARPADDPTPSGDAARPEQPDQATAETTTEPRSTTTDEHTTTEPAETDTAEPAADPQAEETVALGSGSRRGQHAPGS